MAQSSVLITRRLIRPWLSARPADSHKGDFGHVLVVAGSRGMMGAGALCASAALRSGAGLVTFGFPEKERYSLHRRLPRAVMTLPLRDTGRGSFHKNALHQVVRFVRSRRVTSLAVGPGISVTPDTTRLVRGILSSVDVPVVLDADGLNAVAKAGWPSGKLPPLLITPHPGELSRLLRAPTSWIGTHRAESAAKIAKKLGLIAILKGHGTLVTDGRLVYRNPTGNAGLAKGGSGDVLSGVCAAMIGQVRGNPVSERLFRAALISVYVHGRAADLTVRRIPRISLIADDLVDALPTAFKDIFGVQI